MKTKVCVVCGTEFNDKWGRKKSCSSKCKTQLQMITLGRASSQTHGFARVDAVERLHKIWRGMLKRCTCPTSSDYHRYGGRGIKVCEEWVTDYVVFRAWALANGYHDGLTIGRVDNDSGYSPANCRWENPTEQARNRRSSHFETYCGITKTLAEWAELCAIPYGTLVMRVNTMRWPIEKALTEPLQKAAQWLVDGEMLTLQQMADKYEIKVDTLRYRLKRMTVKEALGMKMHKKIR